MAAISYEVGAVFRIVDGASPALKAIAAQLRELDALLIGTKEKLAALSSTRFAGLSERLTGVNTRLGDMGKIAGESTAALTAGMARADESVAAATAGLRALKAEIAEVGAATRTIRGPTGVRARGTGGGGHGGGGVGGGPHIMGPTVPVPGGSHLNLGGGMALGAAGVVAAGVYEEAQMQDAIFQILYHTGMAPTAENKQKFRDVLQDAMSTTGYSLHDVSEAAKDEVRMLKGAPGGGVDVLPELLKISAVEARLKGSGLQESMSAFIGLAHMTKAYGPDAIKKLGPAFAFLSASNPSSLGSMERAAGYAVPILQSGLEIDPMQSLMLGTVLTRAGITSTKSGTWLRNMAVSAMPGTSLMSKMAFKKHEGALRELGLVDERDNPTWFTDGKPDVMKMLDIASDKAANVPLTKRAAYEKQLFGTQGAGAFAILADPAVKDQIKRLRKEMDSEDFKNRYATFQQDYSDQSPVQKARETWRDLQNVLMDIGSVALPVADQALKLLDDHLKATKIAFGDLGTTASSAASGLGSLISAVRNLSSAAAAGVPMVAPPAPGGDRGPTGAPFRSLVPPPPAPHLVAPPPHAMNEGGGYPGRRVIVVGQIMNDHGGFPRSAPAFDAHGGYVSPDWSMT